jgi:hypothetical protein
VWNDKNFLLFSTETTWKAPGFNPWTYQVISWFQAFAFKWVNLYRYSQAEELTKFAEVQQVMNLGLREEILIEKCCARRVCSECG